LWTKTDLHLTQVSNDRLFLLVILRERLASQPLGLQATRLRRQLNSAFLAIQVLQNRLLSAKRRVAKAKFTSFGSGKIGFMS